MRKILYILACVFVIAVSASCGGGGKEEHHASSAQLEAAKNAGREAARKIISREFTDSMEFHGAILEANSEKSKFAIEGEPECVAAFDSAFISTIRTTRPDLAAKLQ